MPICYAIYLLTCFLTLLSFNLILKTVSFGNRGAYFTMYVLLNISATISVIYLISSNIW